jgi:hypothetical protein
VAFPSTTYTPGGPAVSWTVTIPASGGFELSTRVQADNSQAGSLTAGSGSNVVSGTVQYVRSSSAGTTWTFQWTPPAANAGNVAVYVTGGAHNTNFSNSYLLTPAVVVTPETLALSATALTFTYGGGAAPATQAVQVTSSGAPIPFVTSVSTTGGGNWLTATPPGGNTPLGLTVGANPAGLVVGTYTGTVTLTSTGATNSPQTVAVTFNVTAVTPPALPTLKLSSTALNFTAPVGGAAAPQNVQVTSSDSSAVVFTAAAATTSGGNWLSVSPSAGSTPSAEAISVALTGLAAGTYSGTVTFTSSGASNSPVTAKVTLTVTSTTPPPVPSVQFSFNVRDREKGGTDRLLLDGSGSVDAGGAVSGGGSFTRYGAGTGSGGGDDHGEDGGGSAAIIASGTWKATSVTSFAPVAGGRGRGGVLVLGVRISTQGGTSSMGSLRIAQTGGDTGVTLSIDGGATFAPTGVGRVSIRTSGGTGGGGEDGTGDDLAGPRK